LQSISIAAYSPAQILGWFADETIRLVVCVLDISVTGKQVNFLIPLLINPSPKATRNNLTRHIVILSCIPLLMHEESN